MDHRHQLPVATVRDGREYWFRRPGFLAALDHVQYGVAETFLEQAHHRLPHPESLIHELEDVGEKLKQLNFFTVYFTQPTWAPKPNAQKELEPFSFAQLIGDAYRPLPPVQDPTGETVDGAVSAVEYEAIKTENLQTGRHFIRQLRLQLVTHMTEWRKAVVRPPADLTNRSADQSINRSIPSIHPSIHPARGPLLTCE